MKLLFFALLSCAVECADKDVARNVLRYCELKGLEALLVSTCKKNGVPLSKKGKAGYVASMINHLVRTGCFTKKRQARNFLNRSVQRGLRKEGDDGRTLCELMIGATVGYERWLLQPYKAQYSFQDIQ